MLFDRAGVRRHRGELCSAKESERAARTAAEAEVSRLRAELAELRAEVTKRGA